MPQFQHAPQHGRLFVWQYTENSRNYPGWHFSADADGCLSGIAICEELLESRAEQRTLRVTPATPQLLQVPNNRGGSAAYVEPQRLRIEPLGAHDMHPGLRLSDSRYTLRLVVDRAILAALQTAFRDIARGRGDYSIPIGGDELWVWWSP